jgi:hypothetical protein
MKIIYFIPLLLTTNLYSASWNSRDTKKINPYTMQYDFSSSSPSYSLTSGTASYSITSSTSNYSLRSGTATYSLTSGTATYSLNSNKLNGNTYDYYLSSNTAYNTYLSTGVSQIIAGTNITIAPTDGKGNITVNSSVPTSYVQTSDSPTWTGTHSFNNSNVKLNQTQLTSPKLQFITAIASGSATTGSVPLSRKMTSDTAPTPSVCTYSSYLASSWYAYKAFDQVDANTSAYVSNNSAVCWIQYYHGSTILINAYNIKPRKDDNLVTRCPNTWTIWGSNDGVVFSTLSTVSGQTWTMNVAKRFTFTNTTSYSYYRMNVSATNGDNYCTIGELELLFDAPAYTAYNSTFTVQTFSTQNTVALNSDMTKFTQDDVDTLTITNSSTTILQPLGTSSYVNIGSTATVTDSLIVLNTGRASKTLDLTANSALDVYNYAWWLSSNYYLRNDGYMQVGGFKILGTFFLGATNMLSDTAQTYQWGYNAGLTYRSQGSDSLRIYTRVNQLGGYSDPPFGYIDFLEYNHIADALTGGNTLDPTIRLWNTAATQYTTICSSQVVGAVFDTSYSSFTFTKHVNMPTLGVNTSSPTATVQIRGAGNTTRTTFEIDNSTNAAMLKVYDSGELRFLGIGLNTGSIYAEDISSTVVIAATDTYYPFVGGFTAGENIGFTVVGSSSLNCNVAGRYFASWAVSASYDQSDSSIEGAVMVNSTFERSTTNLTGAVIYHLSGSGTIRLNVGDAVKLCFEAEPGTATGTLTVNHATLTLIQIGG